MGLREHRDGGGVHDCRSISQKAAVNTTSVPVFTVALCARLRAFRAPFARYFVPCGGFRPLFVKGARLR